MKLDHLLTLCTRINSKWIKNLNVRLETTKILEKNTCSKISNISCSNICSDMSPQARKTKEKNKQMGLLKIFFTAKKTISKMKRHPTEWENILNKDTSGNGLISKFYKELKILNTKIGFLIQFKNGRRT